MLCSLSSKLGTEDLNAIKTLEQELGMVLLSFNCHDLNPAQLTEDQLSRVQSLEGKLGVALVAVNQ